MIFLDYVLPKLLWETGFTISLSCALSVKLGGNRSIGGGLWAISSCEESSMVHKGFYTSIIIRLLTLSLCPLYNSGQWLDSMGSEDIWAMIIKKHSKEKYKQGFSNNNMLGTSGHLLNGKTLKGFNYRYHVLMYLLNNKSNYL